MYPTQGNEELNVIMFELLILGGLNDYQNKAYYLPSDKIGKIFVEIAHSLNYEFMYCFLNYFKVTELKWDFTNIKVGHSLGDRVQKVCRYLQALEDANKYDPELLANPQSLFTDLECQLLLKKTVLSKLKQPNFYYVNAFISFVAD